MSNAKNNNNTTDDEQLNEITRSLKEIDIANVSKYHKQTTAKNAESEHSGSESVDPTTDLISWSGKTNPDSSKKPTTNKSTSKKTTTTKSNAKNNISIKKSNIKNNPKKTIGLDLKNQAELDSKTPYATKSTVIPQINYNTTTNTNTTANTNTKKSQIKPTKKSNHKNKKNVNYYSLFNNSLARFGPFV